MSKLSEKLQSKKAAIYVRVSTRYQVDRDSLAVQKRELEAYADMILGIKDYVIFEDAGYSAKNTDRPDYQRMMDRLRTGEFSHLLVWKIDRISRNLLDFAAMYAELKKLGIVFVSKNEQFDTSNAVGEAMLKIILVFAELERQMTSERVTAVMLSRANNGQWNGGRVPYGYDYDKSEKTFKVNQSEAGVVTKIYDMYEQYRSIIYINRYLNQSNIKTRAGNSWSPTTVHKILTNPFYIGSYQYNVHNDGKGVKKRDSDDWVTVEGHHEPIISTRQFENVASILTRNQRGRQQENKTYVRKNIHVFAGLLQCGKCGANMSATPGKIRASGWRPSSYCCSQRRNNLARCDNKYVSDVTLGEFIVNYIANILKLKDSITVQTTTGSIEKNLLRGKAFCNVTGIGAASLEDLKDMLLAGNSGLEYRPSIVTSGINRPSDERRSLQERHNRQETALNRLQSLYLYGNGGISEKDYILEREKIMAELSSIEKKLSQLGSEETELPISSEEFIRKAGYFMMVENLLGKRYIDFETFTMSVDKSAQREFIASVIEKIVVTDGEITQIQFKNGIVNTFRYK